MKTKKISLSLLLALFGIITASFVSANGSATVSWIAPTTDEGGGALGGGTNDLTGYRIFYSTSTLDCASWDAASDQTTRLATSLASAPHVDIAEASTIKSLSDTTLRGYTFSNTNLLTVGQTYNFAVVAYDASGNYSKCATDSGSNETVSKLIYRTGKMTDAAGVVNLTDLSLFAFDWGKTNWCRLEDHKTDINGDCKVDLTDLSLFAFEWNK